MRALVSIIRLILLIIWSFICIIVAVIVFLFSYNRTLPVKLARGLWSKPAIIMVGGRRKKTIGLEHLERNQTYILMANHSSYLDIPVLFAGIPKNLFFIAKKELKKVPFLGWYMKMCGMIFIDRKNAKKAKESLQEAAGLIRKGKTVVIFPEGTTSNTGIMGSFKKGGFLLAQESQLPILPVKIKGTFAVWPSTGNFNLKSGPVQVVIGKPIPYDSFKEMDPVELGKMTKQLIEEL